MRGEKRARSPKSQTWGNALYKAIESRASWKSIGQGVKKRISKPLCQGKTRILDVIGQGAKVAVTLELTEKLNSAAV